MGRVGLVLAVAGILLGSPGETASAQTQAQSVCAKGNMAYESDQLDQAREVYLEALKIDSSAPCATKGLSEVTTATHREEMLCALGEQQSESGKEDEARHRYFEALEANVESRCAAEGLAPSAGEKSTKEEVDEWSDLIPKVSLALGTGIAAFLLAIGFLLIVIAAVRRLSRPSLVIKPFGDGALGDEKIGGAVAALIERELIALARQSEEAGDGYQLDFVVANVELLARDDDLNTAVGGLADESNLKLVVGILSLVDRLFGKRSLVAEGELLPEGRSGRGLAIALYRHNELRARDVRWATPKEASPSAYYRLATPASSWVQYEAARSLESHVGLMTDSPESFSLLAVALAQHRRREIERAELSYAAALHIDPENVAALVNLGLLQARYRADYAGAITLLTKALGILKKRHRGIR